MKINGLHISHYYSEIVEVKTRIFEYDLPVLEGLLKYIRVNREKLKAFCLELAISNPPQTEDETGYQYPEGVGQFEYWIQTNSRQFEEYDSLEALVSKVFQAKIPAYMNTEIDSKELKKKEKAQPEPEFNFSKLFVSSDYYDRFIKGLISKGLIEESTMKKMPNAQISEMGGILRLLFPKGFIVRELKNDEYEKAASIFGFHGKNGTYRKGKFEDGQFNKHFLK